MLVDVVTEFADRGGPAGRGGRRRRVRRPARRCSRPSLEIGLPILGLPEQLGGVSEERSAMAGTLVAEALAKGDMGLAVADAGARLGRHRDRAVGERRAAADLPAGVRRWHDVPGRGPGADRAAGALRRAQPAHHRGAGQGDGYVLNGVKSLVPRGAEAELFVVGASLDGQPVLFLVESSTDGLTVEADPSMGVRAASLTKLTLTDVAGAARAPCSAPTDGTTYAECVRLSRLAWCALAVGTGQAVLDYVTPYVKEREAFGEPVAHRQSVAFMVADIAIELQAMRLLTYKAAGRAAAGKDFSQAGRAGPQGCAPTRACGSASTASSCSAATGS